MHSAQCLLFIYSPRVYSQLAGKKRLVFSVSQRQGVNGSANSQQNVSFGNAGKLESPPIEQASLVVVCFYFVAPASSIMIPTRNSPGYPN